MEENAIQILGSHTTMAISTLRPDGWPQTTFVGYANDALVIYFLIFRSSQKFINIQQNDRISIAVSDEPKDIHKLEAMYAAAHATEVTDTNQRAHAWSLLAKRHPNLADFELPEKSETAMMRAVCEHVSVLDYSKGLGHTQALTTGVRDTTPMHAPQKENLSSSATPRERDRSKQVPG